MGASWRDLADACKEIGTRMVLDPQHHAATVHDLELRETLATLTAVLPNAAEAMSMTGTDLPEAAAGALGAYVPLVVVKDGAAGAVLHHERSTRRVPAPGVHEVVDTVGAGDCFDAGFVAGLVGGLPPARVVELGVVCGSLSVSASGGSAAPTAAEIAARYPHLVPGPVTRERGEKHAPA